MYGRRNAYTGGAPRRQLAAASVEVARRADRTIADAEFVVEGSAGGAAGGADGADRFALTHVLALAHVEGGEVRVEGVALAPVGEHDEPPVARVAAGEDHLTVGAGRDGGSVARLDVHPGV